jgi:hypothetical protein
VIQFTMHSPFCAEMMAISLALTHDWLQAAIFAD